MASNTSTSLNSPFHNEWLKCHRHHFEWTLQNGSERDVATHYLVLQECDILNTIEDIDIVFDLDEIKQEIESYEQDLLLRSGKIKRKKSYKKKSKQSKIVHMVDMFEGAMDTKGE
jgi:hypothetical protein